MTSWQLQLAVLVGAVLGQSPNAYDDCNNAFFVGDGPAVGDTSGATVDANLTRDVFPCLAYYHDVWFAYPASCTGMASATVNGACDLVLAYWQGNCSGFSSHSCADMGGAKEGETLLFRVVQDETYLISIADYSKSCSGAINLDMACTSAPENDECMNATVIYDGVQQIGLSNVGASVNQGFVNPCGLAYFDDIWFVWNASCTGKTTITINNTQADLEVVSWSGSTCDSLTGLVCGNTGGAKESDHVTLYSVEGVSSYVSVAGYSASDLADFTLTVTCVPTPPRPVNDECEGAVSVNGSAPYVGSLFGATRSNNTFANCSSDADVWFTYTASCTGTATINVAPSCSAEDLTLQLWGEGSGCGVPGTCIDAGTPNEAKSFFVEKDMRYLFLVGSKTSDPYNGPFTVTISCDPAPPPPANDECEGAYWAVDGSNNGANWGATVSNVSSGCELYSDVWFQFVANCTGTTAVTVSCGEESVLVGWRGNCSTLNALPCAYNGPLQIPTTKGTVYYLSAGSYDVYQGPLLLTLSCSELVITTAPTPAPTGAPTGSGLCPDFQSFLGNCSPANFTNNARCSNKCANAALHVFDGTNLSIPAKLDCFTVVNETWTTSVASAVLSQRLSDGVPLCRSVGFQMTWGWISLCLGLMLF